PSSRPRSGIARPTAFCGGTYPTRSLPRRGVRPHTVTDPDVSRCRPSSTLSRLVLPLPFGPSTATNSPGRISRSSPDHSSRAPERSVAARSETFGLTTERRQQRLGLVSLPRLKVLRAWRHRLGDPDQGDAAARGELLDSLGRRAGDLGVVEQRLDGAFLQRHIERSDVRG